VERGFAVQKHIASLIPRLRSLPQPVIAAVNGPAAGGGFALVLGSDIRIAATTARFNAAFIRIGLSACDIGTSWLLPRLIGAARAQELMLTGRLFDAEEALRIGLLVDVVPNEVLLDAALAKAEEIRLNTPLGVALTKEGMWSALEIPGLQAAIDLENRQQIMASFSDDAREMRRAKSEGRPPHFEG
jgi:enoyl-CoA hydratase